MSILVKCNDNKSHYFILETCFSQWRFIHGCMQLHLHFRNHIWRSLVLKLLKSLSWQVFILKMLSIFLPWKQNKHIDDSSCTQGCIQFSPPIKCSLECPSPWYHLLINSNCKKQKCLHQQFKVTIHPKKEKMQSLFTHLGVVLMSYDLSFSDHKRRNF